MSLIGRGYGQASKQASSLLEWTESPGHSLALLTAII